MMSFPRRCTGTPNWWRLHGNNAGLVSLLVSSDRKVTNSSSKILFIVTCLSWQALLSLKKKV